MKKIDYIILGFILVIALLFRLYKINTPLADLHSWRQVDTAAVARNFTRNGFDLLKPQYDDLSKEQTGYENPEGLRLVEFPLYNAIFAWMYKTAPFVSLEIYGRLVTAFFSLIIIAVIYYLALIEDSRAAAVIGSLAYSVLPFFVFFSRVILPETTALSFAMMAILFMYFYSKKDEEFGIVYFVLSITCFALSLLVKPTTIFYALTIFFLFIRKYRWNILRKLPFYIYFILAFIPLILWRYYISFHPEGIPASSWLIAHVNTYEGMKNIFFRPAFFRWIFYERMANIVFGGYLAFFFVLGLIVKPRHYLLHIILISAAAYLFTFQGGNLQHEYYQTLILPPIAIFIGVGAAFIHKNRSKFLPSIISYVFLTIIFVAAFSFSFYRVQEFYHYPDDLVQIASVIKTFTSPTDKIITDRLGDTTLLYLADRKGSPADYMSLDEFKKMGYSYYVTQNSEKIASIQEEDTYKAVYKNDKFALFKL